MTAIDIRGQATPEELAAVVAAVRCMRGQAAARPDAYERWRAGRVLAVRSTRLDERSPAAQR